MVHSFSIYLLHVSPRWLLYYHQCSESQDRPQAVFEMFSLNTAYISTWPKMLQNCSVLHKPRNSVVRYSLLYANYISWSDQDLSITTKYKCSIETSVNCQERSCACHSRTSKAMNDYLGEHGHDLHVAPLECGGFNQPWHTWTRYV